MREEWDRSADEREAGQPRLGRFPVPGLIRQVRRVADLSQRELAARAGVSQSTVARAEAGHRVPSVDVLQRLLACADFELVVVDQEGHVVLPLRDAEWTRDGADRRYPSHLDVIVGPRPGDWWADEFGLLRPPETFVRDRARRDEQRARSQWEVRAKQNRNVPMPLLTSERERAAAAIAEGRRRARELPPIPTEEYDDVC